MTLLEALKNITPGEIISFGDPNESDFVEIFALQDGTLRFSELTMKITNDSIRSDKWRK